MSSTEAEVSVILATCGDHPTGSPDDSQLAAALERRGCRTRWASWDDRSVDWRSGLVVVRSTWDYTSRSQEFLEWADQVPALRNSADLIRWNHDKSYLDVLLRAGVPTVRTVFLSADEPTPAPDALRAALGGSTTECVIKPTVSAGSRGAGRFLVGSLGRGAAADHLASLRSSGHTAMIQPFLPVDVHGETSIILLGGRFSHAVRRAGMLPPGQVHSIGGRDPEFDIGTVEPVEPSRAELAVAGAALGALRSTQPVLYARVDLFPSQDGPVINELELIEPGLFLSHAPGSTDRFADAISSAAATPGAPRSSVDE